MSSHFPSFRFVFVLMSVFSLAANGREAKAPLNITQHTMTQTLEQIVGIFSQEYAPLDWKVQSQKWNLAGEYSKIRKTIAENPQITMTEFHDLLMDFMKSTRDHHVGISFYSTEGASLPFHIYGAGERYFLVYIDRQKLPVETFPYLEGTEVVAIDGKPVKEVVEKLLNKSTLNPTLTERRIAERKLTVRMRALGEHVPTGQVKVTLALPSGKNMTVPFMWEYQQELLTDHVPVRNELFRSTAFAYDILKTRADLTDMFSLGTKTSFVPHLGPIINISNSEDMFSWYVFRLPSRHNIGYLRINTFNVPNRVEAAQKFGEITRYLENVTDALIIDQTNNDGGDLHYMYSLLARLSDQPLEPLKHRIMVTTELETRSAFILARGFLLQSEQDVKQWFDESAALFPSGYELLQSLTNGARFILSELKQGRRLTNYGAIDGIESIPPFVGQAYTKPLLVLVNELDFSAADFFPAILQDNHRAMIFGTKTAGAGGAVKSVTFPNQFHIREIHYTATIAQRANGDLLENTGVKPDWEYAVTPEDIQGGFQGYRDAVLSALIDLITRVPAPLVKSKQ